MKINSARSQGIHVNILAEQIALKLTELEIVAVMSNILDNAIEACQKVEEKSKNGFK
ncbi:GHKL domain-containing protein [Lachnospiraceae bacterium OF11-28]|nr:GHKL domain-containing protein [Lachnospiraceae bacterium OF11-28]